MNKNIWIINQYAGSPYHGMNYRSYYLAKEFVKKGYSVKIFAGSYSHLFIKLPDVNKMFTNQNIDGINYIWVKTPKYSTSKSIKRVFNMLVFMFKLFFYNIFKVQKPDVIIISSLSLFPVINAYIWSKIFKIEFIFEIRDIWPETFVQLANASRWHPFVVFLSFFEKFGYKKAKYIVSLLDNSKEFMQSRGMQEQKFRYIPNGVVLKDEEVSQKFRDLVPKDKFIVGYVGTIGIANALEYLLESAKLLVEEKDIYFVIVGDGGEKETLKHYVKMHQMDNIKFISAIKKDDVASMLSLFDVCYIGWHDREIYKFGISANKIFDYMNASKPILHSIGIKDELVSRSNSGIRVDAQSPSQIKSAILRFKNMSKDELKKMGENSKKYVKENHSYENLASKYIKLFENLKKEKR